MLLLSSTLRCLHWIILLFRYCLMNSDYSTCFSRCLNTLARNFFVDSRAYLPVVVVLSKISHSAPFRFFFFFGQTENKPCVDVHIWVEELTFDCSPPRCSPHCLSFTNNSEMLPFMGESVARSSNFPFRVRVFLLFLRVLVPIDLTNVTIFGLCPDIWLHFVLFSRVLVLLLIWWYVDSVYRPGLRGGGRYFHYHRYRSEPPSYPTITQLQSLTFENFPTGKSQ